MDEFEIKHRELVERGVSIETYNKEANEWYDKKKEELGK